MHDFSDETVRVTTLELFFDLVFVFTITQLTTVLVRQPTWRGLLQTLLMLGVIWWMYSGYAWLTNAVSPDRSGRRLLLLAGMGRWPVRQPPSEGVGRSETGWPARALPAAIVSVVL